VTGFLLAGIGNENYLIVEEGACLDNALETSIEKLVGREDVAVVFVVHFLEQYLKRKLKERPSSFPIVVAIPQLF
jgi:vacuolar-type H+-ATPase subunit F/Vma7